MKKVNAADVAKAAVNKRRTREAIERKAEEAHAQALKNKRAQLEAAVRDTLAELATLPRVKVNGNELVVNGTRFKLSVDYDCGKCRYSDDSDETPYRNYVIRWRDANDRPYGGMSDIDDFVKSFSEHVAMYM